MSRNRKFPCKIINAQGSLNYTDAQTSLEKHDIDIKAQQYNTMDTELQQQIEVLTVQVGIDNITTGDKQEPKFRVAFVDVQVITVTSVL